MFDTLVGQGIGTLFGYLCIKCAWLSVCCLICAGGL
jgi:hypothetical protein